MEEGCAAREGLFRLFDAAEADVFFGCRFVVGGGILGPSVDVGDVVAEAYAGGSRAMIRG